MEVIMGHKIRRGPASAVLIALMSLASGNDAAAVGDPKRGAQVFQACVACHSVKPGEQLTGPSLARVWNRKAGTVEGFQRYSDALKHANVVWNEATLDKWLANPEQFVAGTSMTFPGVRESKDRQDVIAYLRAVSEGKAPSAEPRRGRMMMQSGKVDLNRAPPAGQVVSLSHCGDTYTVETADGKTQKVWEFNLRFKTDASKMGPLPGKPVIVGAGMQGDRASVVFAGPAEISSFIKRACE
jgi:cytochrome c